MQAKAAAFQVQVDNDTRSTSTASMNSIGNNQSPRTDVSFGDGFRAALAVQFDMWCSQIETQGSCQSAESRAIIASMKREAAILLASPQQSRRTSVGELGQTITPIAHRVDNDTSNGQSKSETETQQASDRNRDKRLSSHANILSRVNSKVSAKAPVSKRNSQGMRLVQDSKRKKRLNDSKKIPPYMISPDSSFRIYWDFLLMVLIFYYSAAVPVRVAFDVEPPSPALENFFTCLFLMDIVLNFNTGIHVKGDLVMDRSTIAKVYMQKWFWIDIAASFPFDWCLPTPADGNTSQGSANKLGRLGKIFRLLRIAKMLRMLKLGRIMVRIRQAIQVSPTWILLTKTLMIMLATWHWSACGYWMIATNLSCNRVSECEDANILDDCSNFAELDLWCPPLGLIEQNNFDLNYAFAFFWGISATSGVGYEIFPYTQAQITYSAMIVIMGSALYCNILASMTSIIQGFGVSSAKKSAQIETISQYLKREPSTSGLRRKIREYYDFMWTDGMGEEISCLVQQLPESFQIDIATGMHADIFNNIDLFSGMHRLAVYFVVKHWQRQYVVQGDKVIEQGDFTSDLYIIFRGCLTMETKSTAFAKLKVGELNDHDYFGEVGLVSDRPVEAVFSVIAKQTCELLIVSKPMFIQLLAKFELSDVEQIVRYKAAQTMARVRWKKAIAKVVLVNRFRVKGKSANDRADFSMVKEERRRSLIEVLSTRMVRGAPKRLSVEQVYKETPQQESAAGQTAKVKLSNEKVNPTFDSIEADVAELGINTHDYP